MSKMISEKNAIGDIEGSFEVVKESAIFNDYIRDRHNISFILFCKTYN